MVEGTIKRSLVNLKAGSNFILDAWCKIINEAYNGYESDTKNIRIAMPGYFDYKEGICLIKNQEKLKSFYNVNIKIVLARRLNIPVESIRFMNDAAAFLQGKIFNDNSITGDQNILGLTLGMGLGTSIHSGRVTADAALWDSSFLNGIAEDYFSTAWFVKRYHALSAKTIYGVKDLLASADTDLYAPIIFKEFGRNLASFLTNLIKKFVPVIIITGGNIAGASGAFLPVLTDTLKTNNAITEIRIRKLNEFAALIGAAKRGDAVSN